MFKRNWQQAKAQVVVIDVYKSTVQGTAGMDSHADIVLEVHPPDAPPFRTETRVNFLGFDRDMRRLIAPKAGDWLEVEYEPKSQKVRILLDEAHDRKARDAAYKAEHDAALHAAPGTLPQPAWPRQDPGQQQPQPVTTELNLSAGVQVVNASGADPAAVIAKLERVKAQGLITEQQFEAAKAQLEGAPAPQPQAGFGAPAGGATAERLRRLDDLHAQKLVTDEEYAAERKRILDSI